MFQIVPVTTPAPSARSSWHMALSQNHPSSGTESTQMTVIYFSTIIVEQKDYRQDAKHWPSTPPDVAVHSPALLQWPVSLLSTSTPPDTYRAKRSKKLLAQKQGAILRKTRHTHQLKRPSFPRRAFFLWVIRALDQTRSCVWRRNSARAACLRCTASGPSASRNHRA